MKIAGFQKQSFIDYPGYISSVVFTQGCNFRCAYCHNPSLVIPEQYSDTIEKKEVLDYLTRYKHLIDAVCITGGEPTLHKALPSFLEEIKKMDLKVKLDSNGTNPNMLTYLIKNNLVDSLAMDIKHILEFDLYNKAVGFTMHLNIFDKILKSIKIIRKSGIDYQFRTTVACGLHSDEHIDLIMKKFGKNHKIQKLNSDVMLDPDCKYLPMEGLDYDSNH